MKPFGYAKWWIGPLRFARNRMFLNCSQYPSKVIRPIIFFTTLLSEIREKPVNATFWIGFAIFTGFI